MKQSHVAAFLLAGFAALALAAAPSSASAAGNKSGKNTSVNNGTCKSGKTVTDTRQCKENGGTK